MHRLLHGARFTTPADRLQVAHHTTDLAIEHAVRLNPATGPVHRGAELYSTQAILDAEQRLLDAGHERTAPALSDTELNAAAPGTGGLGADQAAAVTAIATSGRVVDLLVGPAGTGKTTTVRALRAAWERIYGEGSVVGLAPSAAAAQVLADSLAITTENTAKWLHEHARNDTRLDRIAELQAVLDTCSTTGSVLARSLAKQIIATETECNKWRIRPGQLVILDEASLADTATLDTLTAHIRAAGAKLLLVGDPYQLSPVDAGGALAMLAHDRPDLPELREAHRFTHPWERDASLQLRHGDPAAIDEYVSHDRIRAGDRDTVLKDVYAAWRHDTVAGMTSLMIAADRDTVDALNHRARTDRILNGSVSALGVPIVAGVGGIGDRVVTRRNDRTLRTATGYVKNGDTWIITHLHDDGSMTATTDHKLANATSVHLPAGYVRAHVELGYAVTAHTAQGRTTDTAHAVITPDMTREALYVAATRGRQSNTLNVVTDHRADDSTWDGPSATAAPEETLRGVLARANADTSAHSAIREAQKTPPGPVFATTPHTPSATVSADPYRLRGAEPAVPSL